MQLDEFLSPALTRCKIKLASKKRALEEIAHCIGEANPSLSAASVFESLVARERLGSTGVGDGVAIPHCRVQNCERITGVLLTLEKAIDFEAIDDEPVDLICALLVPEDENSEHLATLAALAEQFGREPYRKALRTAKTNDALFELAVSKPTSASTSEN